MFMPSSWLERLRDEWDRRDRHFDSIRDSVTPDTARVVSNLSRAFPWLPAGVVVPMGLSGMRQTSSAAQGVAALGARFAAERDELRPTGTPVPLSNSDRAQRLGRALQTVAGRGSLSPGTGILGTVGQTIGGLAAADTDEERGAAVREPFRQRVQQGLAAAHTPLEELSAAAQAGVLSARDPNVGFSEAHGQVAPSLLRQRERMRQQGLDADMGEGFMPGGEVMEAQRAQARRAAQRFRPEIAAAYDPTQQFISPGRLAAYEFADPGSTAFDIGSAIVDFAFTFTDPASIALGAAGKASRAGRMVVAPSGGRAAFPRLSAVGESLGLLPGPARNTAPEQIRHYLHTSHEGRQAVQALADEDSYFKIWTALNKQAPHEVTLALRRATTPEEVQDILYEAYSFGAMREKVGPHGLAGGAVSRLLGGALLGDADSGAIMGLRNAVKLRTGGVRAFQWTPHKHVDATDGGAGLENLDRMMRGANLDSGFVEQTINKWAGTANVEQRYRIYYDEVLPEITRRVTDYGLTPAEARKIVRSHAHIDDLGRSYGIDQRNGMHLEFPGSKTTLLNRGGRRNVPTAQLLTEMEQPRFAVPDFREIRRATSPFARVLADRETFGARATRFTVDGLDYAMSAVWIPAQLIGRPLAWLTRVSAEEQARLWAAGLEGAGNDPFSYILWAVGKRGGVDALGQQIAKRARSTDDLLRTRPQDKDFFAEAMNPDTRPAWAQGGTPGGSKLKDWKPIDSSHPRYHEAWARETVKMANDPVAIRLVGGLTDEDMTQIAAARGRTRPPQPAGRFADPEADRVMREAVEQADELPGAARRASTDDLHPDSLTAKQEWFWSADNGREWREAMAFGFDRVLSADDQARYGYRVFSDAMMKSRQFADDYLASYLRRIEDATPIPALRQAIATGKLGNVNLRGIELAASKGPAAQQARALHRWLDGHRRAGPNFVSAQSDLTMGDQLKNHWRAGTDWLFRGLFSRPNDYLSRSPAWKQLYWQRVGEQMPLMDRHAQQVALDNAKKANLSARQLRDLRKAASQADPAQAKLTIGVADGNAKAFALERTKALLYDVTERGQISDMLRIVSPFIEAWREILMTWGRLGVLENPRVLRRAQLGLNAGVGSGFFYEDEQTGDLMFNYPGGHLVTDLGLRFGSMFTEGLDPRGIEPGNFMEPPLPEGTRVGLAGRAQGLNLIGNIFPGVGPVVSVPAEAIFTHAMNDSPTVDDVRSRLIPFGAPADLGEAVLPAWMNRLRSRLFGDEADHQKAQAFGLALHMLAASGEYKDDPMGLMEEANKTRLVEDANRIGDRLLLIQALAQSGAPTTPMPRHELENSSNEWISMRALSAQYRKLMDEHEGDPDAAMAAFVDEFGWDWAVVGQSRSEGAGFRAVTSTGWKWEREHPELVDAAPSIIGLLAPEPEDEFDIQAWIRQNRKPLTARQQAELWNNTLFHIAYRHARQQVEELDTPEAREWLSEQREELMRRYPGADRKSIVGLTAQTSTDRRIDELERVMQMPAFTQGEQTRALAQAVGTYLDARAQVGETVKTYVGANGQPLKDWRRADAARPLRDWLRNVGQTLADETPEFAPVWYRLLRREIEMFNIDDMELEEAS